MNQFGQEKKKKKLTIVFFLEIIWPIFLFLRYISKIKLLCLFNNIIIL